MIAELGLAVLWMAAALAVLQLVTGGLALRPEGRALAGLVRPVAVMQGVLVLAAFAALVTLFVTTDLSVKLVVDNSHSAKPLIFKIAGTWGNHEGSMLMWVTIMAVAGAFVAVIERRLDEPTLMATLAGQAFISLGFYAFLLFASNPFARLAQPADEGQGLNPLLQDVGLAFHPPTLYVGYVGLSIAFSFAIGALVTRNVGPAFARAMRPWVLGAWIFLTLGITAGSYWAYYTLGWGGWWFWDPVENASLMPWLAATALLHSVSVLSSRDALRAWTVMLGVIAFSMSMVGTFLVRSGILTSVHAFAVDPRRGAFILALLAIDIGGALALFTLRAGTVTEGKRFAFVSREGALVFNNVMLSGILGIVLIGTLYPLVTEAYGIKVSVGAPYFNPASAMFAFPMFAVMAVGPLLRWRQDRLTGDRTRRVSWPVLVCAVIAVAVFAGVEIVASGIGLLPALGLALASGLFPAALLPQVCDSAGRFGTTTLLGAPVPIMGIAGDQQAALIGQSCCARRCRCGAWSLRMPGSPCRCSACRAKVRFRWNGWRRWRWAKPAKSGRGACNWPGSCRLPGRTGPRLRPACRRVTPAGCRCCSARVPKPFPTRRARATNPRWKRAGTGNCMSCWARLRPMAAGRCGSGGNRSHR